MASTFCLPKHTVDKFLEKLKSGEINPEKLMGMTSKERNAFFVPIVGETNAAKVNALFESKLLLKNQQLGIINWAKQLTGISKVTKMDMISKIERMTELLTPETEDAFLNDLVNQRLKIDVTYEEAGKIADLSQRLTAARDAIPEGSPDGSPQRLDYGAALVTFQKYLKGLKLEAKALTPTELMTSPLVIAQKTSGVLKSLKASMDASFALRQGYVTLITNPDIWSENFIKSFEIWKNDLKGVDAQGMDGLDLIKAEVFSRENAVNGNYQKIGLDIGLESEEAFPEAIQTKIPKLGVLYKGSMDAFNGAMLRMRADLADRMIEDAISQGVTDLDASGLGALANSMTGRGDVKLLESQAKTVNALIFSIRYFKAQLDILSFGLTNPKIRGTPAAKTAAKNSLKVLGTITGLLLLAKILDPDSVDLDTRSTKFGKIYVPVGNKRVGIDVTAGLRTLIILASRVFPSLHKGKWGVWWKDSRGRYHNVWDHEYGKPTQIDFLVRFGLGKASPGARTLLNLWERKRWDGEEVTVLGEAWDLISPISITNAIETLKTTEGENLFIRMILTGLNMMGASAKEDKKFRKNRGKGKPVN